MKNLKIGSGVDHDICDDSDCRYWMYQLPDSWKESVTEPNQLNNCEVCHTDYERLVDVHSPDTAAPVGGCGGDAPHYEPYDRVFMGGYGL